jgi:hypothetical protein
MINIKSILILSSHVGLGVPSGLFPLGVLRSFQIIIPGPKHVCLFRNKARFYAEELLAPRPTP